tara:strand:+ start:22693 stop:24699 length:2007 start_codon:yes stop_codon:yes gene_type:complete
LNRYVIQHAKKMLLFIAIPSLSILVGCTSGDRPNGNGTDQTSGCSGSCADASSFLTVSDVEKIISQGVFEAQSRGVAATIAVSDRVGNILGLYKMTGANTNGVTVTTNGGIDSGLDGAIIPSIGNGDVTAAIAKAITGAYLSSEGNAFSTRTAGQIIQDHFNPGEDNQPAGPLFGVQFSQLACSDLILSDTGGTSGIGPKRSPLGLSADPGGFPLYKNGTVVGGVGVISDEEYTLDKNLLDIDYDQDEVIALAASFSFIAPADRQANRITVDGKTLRFSDALVSDISSNPTNAPTFASIGAGVGSLLALTTYTDGTIRAGTAFGTATSGIRADAGAFASLDGFVLVDALDNNRFSPTASVVGASPLSQPEVSQILQSALAVSNKARAQIRRPLGTPARVTISVVDAEGNILGIVRGRDAPVFGIDVSLQKARTAAFFSSSQANTLIQALPDAEYLLDDLSGVDRTVDLSDYVIATRNFLGLPTALADGAYAFTDRAGGNLSRPFYPDGLQNSGAGPLSKPAAEWSAFSTGFQLDTVYNSMTKHLAFLLGVLGSDVTSGCGGKSFTGADVASSPLLANGLQIFPGSVPIYRNGDLVGAIGVSGDGVDQDDMIAFLGVHNAGLSLSGSINNAPASIRADNLQPQGVRLRYVQCPQAPFINDDAMNVCDGK